MVSLCSPVNAPPAPQLASSGPDHGAICMESTILQLDKMFWRLALGELQSVQHLSLLKHCWRFWGWGSMSYVERMRTLSLGCGIFHRSDQVMFWLITPSQVVQLPKYILFFLAAYPNYTPYPVEVRVQRFVTYLRKVHITFHTNPPPDN